MKIDDQFILDIKRLGINGEGIGFYNKMAVFVDGAIPGEGHEIVITKCEKNMVFGKTVNIKHASNNRKEAECPYYESCGGCKTMHISYDAMLEYKRSILIESLNRYSNLKTNSFEIRKTVPSPDIFNYRNKSQLNVKKFGDISKVCMIKSGSNELVPVDTCLVQNNTINELNEQILKLADQLGIQPYIYKFNRGVLKYIVIRVNKNDEALVCLVCNEKNSKIKELAIEIMKLKNVKGVYENFNDSFKQGIIFGNETNHLCGDKFIVENLGKIKYQIYPTTFFQLNTLQAEQLFNEVLKSCKLSFKETVLDAYCGVGTIGLFLAKMSKEVIGIEYNKDSVIAATENAKLNNIKNSKFFQGDATELLPKMINDGYNFDVVVVDPPRVGLGEKFIETILNTNIKRIVYVSCNPSTLAKDLNLLKEKYKVNYITPFDMFPQTPLVESVCVLTKNEK